MFHHVGGFTIYSDKLCTAIQTNDTGILDELLKDVDVRTIRDSYNRSLLHIAAAKGNIELATRLVDAGCDIDACDLAGNTPLIVATFFIRDEVIPFLINAGVDLFAKNNHGYTATTYASMFNVGSYWKSRKQLVNIDDFYALYLEAEKQKEKMNCGLRRNQVENHYEIKMSNNITMDAGMIKIAYSNHIGLLAMYSQQYIRFEERLWKYKPFYMAILYLREDNPISKIYFNTVEPLEEVLNEFGEKAVHVAAKIGNLYLLKLLLRRGADPNAVNRYGLTPRALLRKNHYELPRVDLLLDTFGGRINYPENEDLLRMTKHEVIKGLSVYEFMRFEIPKMMRLAPYAFSIKSVIDKQENNYPSHYIFLKAQAGIMMKIKKQVDRAAEELLNILPIQCDNIARNIASILDWYTLHALAKVDDVTDEE